MQSLTRSALHLRRRLRVASSPPPASLPPRLSSTPSPSRWWPSTLARRDASLMAASASPSRPQRCDSRYLCAHGSRNMATITERKVKKTKLRENQDKDQMLRYFRKIKQATGQSIARNGNGNGHFPDGVIRARLLPESTHRDGSIFNDASRWKWKRDFCIADDSETLWEAKALSDPKDCRPDKIHCFVHRTSDMLQIFSLKLAEVSVDGDPLELYGYVAVRDHMDTLRNYIFNRSSEDPIIVKQGSH